MKYAKSVKNVIKLEGDSNYYIEIDIDYCSVSDSYAQSMCVTDNDMNIIKYVISIVRSENIVEIYPMGHQEILNSNSKLNSVAKIVNTPRLWIDSRHYNDFMKTLENNPIEELMAGGAKLKKFFIQARERRERAEKRCQKMNTI